MLSVALRWGNFSLAFHYLYVSPLKSTSISASFESLMYLFSFFFLHWVFDMCMVGKTHVSDALVLVHGSTWKINRRMCERLMGSSLHRQTNLTSWFFFLTLVCLKNLKFNQEKN